MLMLLLLLLLFPVDCPLSCESNPFQGLERTGGEAGNRAFADGSHVGEERNSWWYSLGITDRALTTQWYNGDGNRDGMPGPCDESMHETLCNTCFLRTPGTSRSTSVHQFYTSAAPFGRVRVCVVKESAYHPRLALCGVPSNRPWRVAFCWPD